MKKINKIIGILMSMIMVFVITIPAFATEYETKEEDSAYVIVNGEDIVYEGENYDNPETGEYFHWNTNSRGVVKEFSFKIRYSITSSSFTINSTSATITSDAHVVNDSYDWVSGYENHKYKITLSGLINRTFTFTVGEESATASGLRKGGSYTVTISNVSDLGSDTYLSGSGTISTN